MQKLSGDSYYTSFLNNKANKERLKKSGKKLIVVSNKFFTAGKSGEKGKNLYVGLYLDEKSESMGEVVVIRTGIDITGKKRPKDGRIWLFDEEIEKGEVTVGKKKGSLEISSLSKAIQEEIQSIKMILFALSDNPDPKNREVFTCKLEEDLIDLRRCFEGLDIDTIKFFLIPLLKTPSDSNSLSFKYSDTSKFGKLDHKNQNMCISFRGFSDKAFSSVNMTILNKDKLAPENEKDKLVKKKIDNDTTFYSLCLSEKLSKKLGDHIKNNRYLVHEKRKILPEHSEDNILGIFYKGLRDLQKELFDLIKKDKNFLSIIKGDPKEVKENIYVLSYLDEEVYSGILRLLYIFAKDGLNILAVILDAYIMSPLLFWGTLNSFLRFCGVFRDIQGDGNLIKLERYINDISKARNNRFHGVMPSTHERLIILRHGTELIERIEEFRYFRSYQKRERSGSQNYPIREDEEGDEQKFRESLGQLYGRGKDRRLTVRECNLSFKLLEAVLLLIKDFDAFLTEVKICKLEEEEERQLLQRPLQALKDASSSFMKIEVTINQEVKKHILERSRQVLKDLISVVIENMNYGTNGKTRKQFIDEALFALDELAFFFIKIFPNIFSEDLDEEARKQSLRLLEPPNTIVSLFEELKVCLQNGELNKETRILAKRLSNTQKKLTTFLKDPGQLIQNGELNGGFENGLQRLLRIHEDFKSLLEDMNHILNTGLMEQTVEF